MQLILINFVDVFENKLCYLKIYELSLHLKKKNVEPVFLKTRTVIVYFSQIC